MDNTIQTNSLVINCTESASMSLSSFEQAVHQFTQRIKGSLDLEQDRNNLIFHRKNVISWIQQQSLKIKEQSEREKKNQHIFTGILNMTGINQPNKKLISSRNAITKIKTIMSKQNITFDENEVQELELPADIMDSLKQMNKVKIPQYYAYVSAPFMENHFLRTREDFDNCLKRVNVNNLRFINLGSDSNQVIKYQRILVEQLFNWLYNEGGQLSMTIKIEIEKENFEKSIQIFCYIEDTNYPQVEAIATMKQLRINSPNCQLRIERDGEAIKIDEMTMLSSFLTQMIVVPIQTAVADYAVQISNKTASIMKMHLPQIDKSVSRQTEHLHKYIKQHPSLRNPLFFFHDFIKQYEYSAGCLTESLNLKRIYSNFYEILNIICKIVKNDFHARQGNSKINSLGINQEVFQVIWKIFHKIAIIPEWIQQVISPLKESLTTYEIINKIYPIFNQVLKLQRENYEQFQKVLLNIPIQNYLSNVSKVNIEQYKDLFINYNCIQFINYRKTDPFDNIFANTINNYDLSNIGIYESLYFLNFIAKNNSKIFKNDANSFHPSWRSKKLWKDIIALRNSQFQTLPYLSICLDILGLHFDFDPIQFSNFPFGYVKNDVQNAEFYEKIDILINILNARYPKKKDEYLSFLIEKSFKHKKFKVVEFLLKKGVHINNYEEVFTVPAPQAQGMRESLIERIQEKQRLKELMKNRQPQMYRKYQWQELINIKLRYSFEGENLATIQTIRRGRFYVDRQIYSHLTNSANMSNTISRKDYMFSTNRLIAKLNIFQSQAYIEVTQYPLLRYFYTFFLNKLGKSGLALNFCGFFSEKGNLVHLIECIPQCFNFEKGLSIHTQTELKNYTNEDDISEAIIVSMILMPTNVLLKNIIISPMISQGPNKSERKSLFIVDFHDFYQKNGFESQGGNTVLKVKNSLFIFDEMKNVISEKLLKKYSTLNVFEIIKNVFKECGIFIKQVNSVKPKNIKINEDQQQLYSIIFQNSFCEILAERMLKIQHAFDKCIRNKSHIDHLQLLQLLNPSLSYYYQEIIQSSPKLIERQRMLLEDSFKKSLIVDEKLVHFLPNQYYIEEVRDAFPNHYKRFGFQGPSENLFSLYQNIRKFKIYTQKIVELKQYSHDIIEYFIRNIDLSTYSKDQRESLVQRIQQYSKEYLQQENKALPLSIIRINNLDSIKEKTLKFSDERLKELIFEDVKCYESEFNSLLKKYHSMRVLCLKNVAVIDKIGQSFINVSEGINLKNLRYLSIVGCSDLALIDLRADQLEHVTCRKNRALSQIYIYSQKLKNLDCSECTKLRLENIGIYILKKVNVLICQNSCDGDVKKLQDKNYSAFLTRILRYLFNRFEQSNTYKFQLIMTLIKLDLIDEKLFGFKSSQVYSKSLVSIVAKVGKDIMNIVQSQVFDLFLRNSEVTELHIDELLKIEISSLVSIEGFLNKMIKMKSEEKKPFRKEFSGLIFKQFIKIPQYYLQHLSYTKSLLNFIDTEKVFKLTLSFSTDIPISQYMELISILNLKDNLEKIEIVIQNSIIDNDIFLFLFSLDDPKNKISRLQFISCELRTTDELNILGSIQVRTLVLTNSLINSLLFIRFFPSLSKIEINQCAFQQEIIQIYKYFRDLKNIFSLTMNNMKCKTKEAELNLEVLFEILRELPKLQQLDFSHNSLNKQQLQYFSSQVHKIKIYQLTLINFYDPNCQEYIQDFLYHDTLKILSIQLSPKQPKLLQSFINSLAKNRSIMRVNFKTDCELQSTVFQKMKQNKKLQTFSSNQPIPNWLKNHICSNQRSKSMIYGYEHFQPEVNSGGKSEDFYRIGLSLDGGGVRGLLLATELDYISKKVGKPLHKIFDCVGGTSIGGILALASTGSNDGYNPVCSTSDLIDIFEIYGNRIFKKSQFGHFAGLFENKYDVKSFEQLLAGYFKQSKLSDVLTDTNVVITAVNRLTNEDVIFRSLGAVFDRNKDFYLRDIARATSAAPTYFPSAEIKNINATQKFSLIDGGVGLNNPSKLVIDDVIKITQNQAHKKNYFLLSLGTGRLINEAIPTHAGIKDLAPIIDSLTESANFFIEKDLAQNYKGHFLRVSPLINLHRKDGELDNTSPEIIKVYKETGLHAAEENFSNNIAFGKYKNQSLIEWLQENTDKKYEV